MKDLPKVVVGKVESYPAEVNQGNSQEDNTGYPPSRNTSLPVQQKKLLGNFWIPATKELPKFHACLPWQKEEAPILYPLCS